MQFDYENGLAQARQSYVPDPTQNLSCAAVLKARSAVRLRKLPDSRYTIQLNVSLYLPRDLERY